MNKMTVKDVDLKGKKVWGHFGTRIMIPGKDRKPSRATKKGSREPFLLLY